jgi:hypothetical protein
LIIDIKIKQIIKAFLFKDQIEYLKDNYT